ncbi:hypothetical protein QEM35_004474 [Pseudomonas putida]|nr:hypothetical protein [Pseudomonas putida]EKT4496274.1 hypothetical protein [Pseudomonas putida]EKT4515294.1 hypothetical protein [Pseudomonas putida]EKT8867203.1 hypothetical protein [Pseudomonas putida]
MALEQVEIAGITNNPVGADSPAKQATRWMAPASPVFAGEPAPTRDAQALRGFAFHQATG